MASLNVELKPKETSSKVLRDSGLKKSRNSSVLKTGEFFEQGKTQVKYLFYVEEDTCQRAIKCVVVSLDLTRPVISQKVFVMATK